MELKGTTAIITGSTSPIGSAIAIALAQRGCHCLCHYNRSGEKAAELTARIQKLGVKAAAVSADLTDPGQIDSLFEKAQALPAPRVLINSAAVFSRQPIEGVNFEQARAVLDLNLIAPLLMSCAFAKKIKVQFPDAGSTVASIVNISDVGGIRPWAGYAVYCASKAGLIAATKAMAKELAPIINVNSVAPGIVTFHEQCDEAFKARQLSHIPAGRIGRPEEIAQAVICLLQNDYITGQVLNVDGGRCI